MAVLGTWIKTCDALPSVNLYNRSSISCVSGFVVLRFVKADIHGILRKVVCFRGSDGQLGEDQIRSAGQKMRKYRVRRSCDTHTDTYFTYFTLLPFLFRMLYWNLVCLEPIPKLLKNSFFTWNCLEHRFIYFFQAAYCQPCRPRMSLFVHSMSRCFAHWGGNIFRTLFGRSYWWICVRRMPEQKRSGCDDWDFYIPLKSACGGRNFEKPWLKKKTTQCPY